MMLKIVSWVMRTITALSMLMFVPLFGYAILYGTPFFWMAAIEEGHMLIRLSIYLLSGLWAVLFLVIMVLSIFSAWFILVYDTRLYKETQHQNAKEA